MPPLHSLFCTRRWSSEAWRVCYPAPGQPGAGAGDRGPCSPGHAADRSHAPLVRYGSFQYQAASGDRPRRVIAKVEHHLGELFPRVGFIVTTLTGTKRAVGRSYNRRGTAEQWIREGKAATHWTRLSCHRLRANEVRLLLGAA